MPTIFCPIPPNPCSDPSVPTTNYSSESPDGEQWYGRNYGTQLNPPLGSDWRASHCLGTCVSTVSQEEADQCAQRANITCLSNEWPVLEENLNPDQPDNPFIPRPRTTYGNDPQECSFTCPDGSVFTQQIPADTFLQFNQATADTAALSLCQNEVVENRICWGDLTPTAACANSLYDGSVSVSGMQSPYTFTVVSGSIAPLVMTQDATTAFLSGNVTTPGTISFRLRAQDAEGNFAEKDFTIKVLGISPATLPNATVGVAYSQFLTAVGPTTGTITWAIFAGTLPNGLTLNSATGEISGVPTTAAGFLFTATFTDQGLNVLVQRMLD